MSAAARRTLWIAAGILVLAGIGLRVVPAGVPAVPVAGPEPYQPPAQPTGEEQAAALLSFNQIIDRDLFRSDRTAPPSRYTPPELVAGTAEPAEAPAEVEAPPAPRPAPPLRLFGTAVGEDGSVALIDADPGIPGAEVYRVGDRVRGARIIQILETAVVLEGADGRFSLTLPSIRRSP